MNVAFLSLTSLVSERKATFISQAPSLHRRATGLSFGLALEQDAGDQLRAHQHFQYAMSEAASFCRGVSRQSLRVLESYLVLQVWANLSLATALPEPCSRGAVSSRGQPTLWKNFKMNLSKSPRSDPPKPSVSKGMRVQRSNDEVSNK